MMDAKMASLSGSAVQKGEKSGCAAKAMRKAVNSSPVGRAGTAGVGVAARPMLAKVRASKMAMQAVFMAMRNGWLWVGNTRHE